MAVASLVLVALFGGGQMIGKGQVLWGSVTGRVFSAVSQAEIAGQALAEQDYKKSQIEFAASRELISSARGDIRESFSLLSRIVPADKALEAGEKLTLAGEELSLGLVAVEEGEALSGLEQALKHWRRAEELVAEAESGIPEVGWSSELEQLQKSLPKARAALRQVNEYGNLLFALMGGEEQREYLLIFQNNHELRPTGGFIGSLGLINVDRGRVESVDVQTVYDPDGQLTERIEPPEPLKKITDRWYLRDANWFIDFPTSAGKIGEFFEKEGGATVDGIIAVNPKLIQGLLKITGPLAVPDYNLILTSENFVEVTQNQVTYNYDKELNRPKQFLADVAPLLLNKIINSENQNLLGLLDVWTNLAESKDILVYLKRDSEQSKISELGWAGELQPRAGVLGVNTANIGGHKSDQFIDQEIDVRARVLSAEKTEIDIEIRRQHHGPGEGLGLEFLGDENPASKDNIVWQRVLIPEEAYNINISGNVMKKDVRQQFELKDQDLLKEDLLVADWKQNQEEIDEDVVIGMESGVKYVGFWQVTQPGATSKVRIEYDLPLKKEGVIDSASSFVLNLMKQPGDDRTSVRVEILLPPGARVVKNVPEVGVTRLDARNLVYRGKLIKDVVVGVVFTK